MVHNTLEKGIMPKETAQSGAKVRQKASIELLGQDQCHQKVGEGRGAVSSRAIRPDLRELVSVEHEHK